MAKMTYAEQLRHPNWQRRRLEMLSAANWECADCGDRDSTLNVHHKRYVKGRMAWEYSDEELIVLCEPCHRIAHLAEGWIGDIFVAHGREEALSLLAGYYCQSEEVDPGLIESRRQVDGLVFLMGVCASLLNHLDIDGIVKVAYFAASLTPENSEARPICEKWMGELHRRFIG